MLDFLFPCLDSVPAGFPELPLPCLSAPGSFDSPCVGGSGAGGGGEYSWPYGFGRELEVYGD